jgi:TaqI-like C-terminal specificity domain/N-6 DNA Methylase
MKAPTNYPKGKDNFKKGIEILANKFEKHKSYYTKETYKEENVKTEFINPMFASLGWDIANENCLHPEVKEVIFEDNVLIDGRWKHPDYSFNHNRKKLFFLDAKKPSIDLKNHEDSAKQIRLYGWNGRVPISVLTDFEEFSIYNCTIEPKQNESAATARIIHLKYDSYIAKLDYIYEYFYQPNVIKGSLYSLIKSDTTNKGTQTVDKRFLASLEKWRSILALAIYKNNASITNEILNFLVQQLIDRIIFLRICESRNIEKFYRLRDIANGDNCYKKLLKYFLDADNKYNSGLFDFKSDVHSFKIHIDDSALRSILLELYYPLSPYLFSVIPVEIIGNAYEQFLGNEIRIDNHKVVIEQKPEVRKAGGVYYTPQYIVTHIVENTIGKLIKGKSPDQISKIKILDPSCGSGSFLLGAYQYLLDYHLDYYLKNKAKLKTIPVDKEGKLHTLEKKRILNNNIFGVDLDERAVEIAKLSLLLEVLDDETSDTLTNEHSLGFKEKILPNLDMNIKCGNSLIGNDLKKVTPSVSKAEIEQIKPFDWQIMFPQVFKQGGFDCVVGNPPYGATLTGSSDFYIRQVYEVANYQLDTYIVFIEKATKLIKKEGLIGYIIPSAWVASTYDIKLREYLAKKVSIESMVITPKKTFEDASVETCILIAGNGRPNKEFSVERWDSSEKYAYNVSVSDITSNPHFNFPIYSNQNATRLIKKIQMLDKKLSDVAGVVWGTKIYEKGKGIPAQKSEDSENKIFHSDKKIKKTHRPLIGGGEITRYALNWKGGFVDYGKWLAAPRSPEWFENERIVVREVTAKGVIQATIIDGDYVYSNSVDGIKLTSEDIKIEFLLGILNSKLMSFYHSNTSANAFKGTFPKVLLQDLRELPVPTIDKKNQKQHDKLVILVKEMMQLKTDIGKAATVKIVDKLEMEFNYKDKAINSLVYELYGLTDSEIELIENS